MPRCLPNKSAFLPILLLLAVVIGCKRSEPHPQPQRSENVASSVPDSASNRGDGCKTIGKVASEGNNIVVCSFAGAKTLNPGTALKFSTSNATLYKEIGKDLVVIRDFANWMPQISFLDFAFEFEVDSGKELTFVKIWFPSEDFPDWNARPLFVERIDLRTGATVLWPLKKLPKPEVLDVAGRYSEINVPSDRIDINARKKNMERLEFLYGNLFAIRDYGFYDPVQSKKYLEALGSWNWNDGEVAEVVAVMKEEVEYLKGKTVEIPNTE